MTWRILYQGVWIGFISLIAFILGLAVNGTDEYKISVAQTMSFSVLALSELVHVFNIRDNKESLFKTNPFNNSKLILAIVVSATLMLVVLFIPTLRRIFDLEVLPKDKLIETIALIFSPILFVEIFKKLKLNGKD